MTFFKKIGSVAGAGVLTLSAAAPAWAQAAAAPVATVNMGDTAWMLISTVLVLAMFLPGLALYLWLLVMVPLDGSTSEPRALRLSRGLVHDPGGSQGRRAQNQLFMAGLALLGLALALVVLVTSGRVSLSGLRAVAMRSK